MITLIQSTRYDILMSLKSEVFGDVMSLDGHKTIGTVDIPNIMNSNVQNVLAMRALYQKFRGEDIRVGKRGISLKDCQETSPLSMK